MCPVCVKEDCEELDQAEEPARELKPTAGPSSGLSLEEVEAQIIQYQVTQLLLELCDHGRDVRLWQCKG